MENFAPRAELARSIIDSVQYMVLGTADEAGRPWANPVWFAAEDDRTFYWVSSPEARHSQNIANRPEIGIVIFDSSVRPGAGQGVYMEAEAEEVPAEAIDHGLAVFSERSSERGLRAWTTADVGGDSLRLYRARARTYSMLAKDGQPDHRVAVDLKG